MLNNQTNGPLHNAIIEDSTDVCNIRALLDEGFDPNQANSQGKLPIHLLLEEGTVAEETLIALLFDSKNNFSPKEFIEINESWKDIFRLRHLALEGKLRIISDINKSGGDTLPSIAFNEYAHVQILLAAGLLINQNVLAKLNEGIPYSAAAVKLCNISDSIKYNVLNYAENRTALAENQKDLVKQKFDQDIMLNKNIFMNEFLEATCHKQMDIDQNNSQFAFASLCYEARIFTDEDIAWNIRNVEMKERFESLVSEGEEEAFPFVMGLKEALRIFSEQKIEELRQIRKMSRILFQGKSQRNCLFNTLSSDPIKNIVCSTTSSLPKDTCGEVFDFFFNRPKSLTDQEKGKAIEGKTPLFKRFIKNI